MDQLLGPLLGCEATLDLAVLLRFVALAPLNGIGLEGLERLGDGADLVGPGDMRDDAVHVPLHEAQDHGAQIAERLGDRPPEGIADTCAHRGGEHHGDERRGSRPRNRGRNQEGRSTANTALPAKASVSFERKAMEISRIEMR